MTLASGVLVARLLGAEGRGLVAALAVAPTIVLALCELGIMHSAACHLGRKTFERERIIAALSGIGIVTIVLACAACGAYYAATWLPAYSWPLALLAIAAVPAQVIRSYASGVFLGVQQIKSFNRASWIGPALRLVLIIALAGGLAWGAYGVLAAAAIAGFAISGYALYLVGRIAPLRPRFEMEAWRALIGLGVSFAAALFIMTLLYKINIVLLQRLASLEEVGVYTVGSNLAEYIWQIPGAMTAVIFSRGANAADPDAYTEKLLVLFRLTLATGLVGACAIAAVAPFLIPFVYGADFERSATVLIAMLPGVTAFMVYKVLN
ncbi:MAG: oligosaccharide flippase family protein, partial [Pseudomonadota bacterium]